MIVIYVTKHDKDVTPVIGLSHVIVTQSYNIIKRYRRF